MKKFFYLMSLCLCMFMGATLVTSCGDDDEEEKLTIEMSSLTDGTVESGNTIKHTFLYSSKLAYLFTVTFDDNEKCNSFIQQFVYASVADAQQAWTKEKEDIDDPENWSISSNVITWNRTDEFKGDTKQDIRDILGNFSRD